MMNMYRYKWDRTLIHEARCSRHTLTTILYSGSVFVVKIHKLTVLEILFGKRLHPCQMGLQNGECFKSGHKAECVNVVNTDRLLRGLLQQPYEYTAAVSRLYSYFNDCKLVNVLLMLSLDNSELKH